MRLLLGEWPRNSCGPPCEGCLSFPNRNMFVVPYLTLGLIKQSSVSENLPAEDVEEDVGRKRPANVITGPDGEILHDKYGFFLTDTFHKMLGKSPEEVDQRNAKERERTSKWVRMIKRWDFVCKYRSSKLKRRIRKGIPNTIRAWAWLRISGTQKFRDKYPDPNKLNVDTVPMKVKEDVSCCNRPHS